MDSNEGESSTTYIYSIDNSGVERLLEEQNEFLQERATLYDEMLEERFEYWEERMNSLHDDLSVQIASMWLLIGVVIGAAVGKLIYHLLRA